MILRISLTLLLAAIAGRIDAQETRFDAEVAPLLIERCIECHGGAKAKGGLDLTKKAATFKGGKNGPAIVAKNLEQSVLWQRVEAGAMPPKKPLPEKEKAILKAWIAGGAVWGTDPIDPFRVTSSKRAGNDWWSLQPVKISAVPNVKQKDWPRNPIDHFILAKLEAEGLTPSPQAGLPTLIRRLYYDLTGLPPPPEDPKNWLRLPLVETNKLLASPHYGERWGRHWLDIVRFGESNGFEHDELRKNAWPYRDWVIQAINRDMPYNEFTRLQIAGDVLRTDDPSSISATGFLVAGSFDSVGQGQPSLAMRMVVRQDELEDIVGTIGQTFLGLTVQCARCHDHKFDPVRIDEYYRLTAAVAGVRHGERDIVNPQARLAFEKQQTEISKQLDELRASLTDLEKPIRAQILAARGNAGKEAKVILPTAFARWDFTKGPKDEVAGLEAKLHNGAILKADGLHLLGSNSYASTPALAKPIGAKTLTAVVRLHTLNQRGGAPISLQSLDGQLFDAIVYGEREPAHWMPGSNGFVRTSDLNGPAESEARDKPVHVAISYYPDGTITGYRNGVPYGKPYKANGFQSFEANKSMLLFGLRHGPEGGGKHLAGTILRAELYDRVLTPPEVAASAGVATYFIADEEIAQHFDPVAKAKWQELKRRIEQALARRAIPAPTNRVYAVMPKTPDATHLLLRGNTTSKGTLLTAGGVASLGLKADFANADASDAERRLKLAEWITDAKNPLFARVMVNRLWHYHFGAGLVETPSDFGFNGARPSHPELLDWLAAEFITSGYSMKHMHRLIVNSATYRQSSRFRADAAKRDAGNRWLWRKSPLRLEAEAVRDSILSVAGQLNTTPGGPGYQDFKVTVRGATHYYAPIDADDPALYRRSIYRTWARGGRNGLLDSLDCPDPSTVSPRRAMTTTPLQALSMMNNSFVLRMADRFAERLKKEVGNDVARQIIRAYELAYGRRATDDEIACVRPVIERHGLAIFCRAVFNSNEFVYVD